MKQIFSDKTKTEQPVQVIISALQPVQTVQTSETETYTKTFVQNKAKNNGQYDEQRSFIKTEQKTKQNKTTNKTKKMKNETKQTKTMINKECTVKITSERSKKMEFYEIMMNKQLFDEFTSVAKFVEKWNLCEV